jgi:hypothetical protein
MNANCSYWSDENMPGIGSDGLFTDKGFYVKYATAFRDYNGNTIFAGSALIGQGFVGAATYKFADGVFVRQEASGNIVLDNNIPCDQTKTFGPTAILYEKDGNLKINVYPAKEGHIMVSEYNRKEKTTRFSIEAP